jgi:hypothetical protein
MYYQIMIQRKKIAFEAPLEANEAIRSLSKRHDRTMRDLYDAALLALAATDPETQDAIIEAYNNARLRAASGGNILGEFKKAWILVQSQHALQRRYGDAFVESMLKALHANRDSAKQA